MPQGKSFWNPYRWVPVMQGEVPRETPRYHHRWEGIAGRLDCTLEALTPFLINDGTGSFIRSRRTQQPFIPGTSLKGAIRSLAELVGNACVPFPKVAVDHDHRLAEAAEGNGPTRKLDAVARTFGYLDGKQVFAGLVRFGDGHPLGKLPSPLSCNVAVGPPKPEHHPFYPGDSHRKLYHHRVGATSLTPPHPGITQTSQVRPLRPGVRFGFRVDFANLREEELALLLYCLGLEEDVQVTLSKEAAGGADAVTLRGPLRHKLGHCKPHGGGSVHIRIEKMELRSNPADRYRGGAAAQVLEGEPLRKELERRTQAFRDRQDPTMQHLRAMLIYAERDPRAANVNYPTYGWFQDDKGTGTPLKPTL
jgi:CRISPR/Cas system CSM-associated protein Csm3 (group 7 of RAMP superfamily)